MAVDRVIAIDIFCELENISSVHYVSWVFMKVRFAATYVESVNVYPI